MATPMLAFDRDRVHAASTRLVGLAEEVAAVRTSVAMLVQRLGRTSPSAVVHLQHVEVDCRELAADLRHRVARVDRDPGGGDPDGHWDRVWRLRDELDHLGSEVAAEVVARLPEADRQAAPLAVALDAVGDRSDDLGHVLAVVASLLEYAGPSTLGALGAFLAQVELPAVHGLGTESPVATMLGGAAAAAAAGEVDPTLPGRLADLLAGATEAALADGAPPTDVLGLLGADRVDAGPLGDLLGRLEATTAAALLAALLAGGSGPPPAWLFGPDSWFDRIVHGVAAEDPPPDGDQVIELLLAVEAASPHLGAHRGAVAALLAATLPRLARPGALDGDRTPMTVPRLRELLVFLFGSRHDAILSTALGVAGTVDRTRTAEEYRAIGRLVGTVLDAAVAAGDQLRSTVGTVIALTTTAMSFLPIPRGVDLSVTIGEHAWALLSNDAGLDRVQLETAVKVVLQRTGDQLGLASEMDSVLSGVDDVLDGRHG